MTEEYQQLFNRIFVSLSHHDTATVMGGVNVPIYKMQWMYRGSVETYYFTRQKLSEFVEDILFEQPRCKFYRNAEVALTNQETRLVRKGKYNSSLGGPWPCDVGKYMTLRNHIFNLNGASKDGKQILMELRELGPNPTQGLDNDSDQNRLLCHVLLNKFWRTKEDFEKKKSSDSVRKSMISDMMRDPIKTIQCNQYAYAALLDHAVEAC